MEAVEDNCFFNKKQEESSYEEADYEEEDEDDSEDEDEEVYERQPVAEGVYSSELSAPSCALGTFHFAHFCAKGTDL